VPACFIHQPLPEVFKDLDIIAFCKFLVCEELTDSSPDIDFAEWDRLLAFLQAKPSITERLKKFAESASGLGPQAVVSAWKHLNIMCQDRSGLCRVPKIDANVAFFAAHNYDVIIDVLANSTVFVPTGVLDLLHIDHAVLCTSKLVAPKRLKYDVYMLLFLSNERVVLIGQVLEQCGYLLMSKHDEIFAFAPANSDYDNLVFGIITSEWRPWLFNLQNCEQVYMSSPKNLHYSAQAKHEWTTGIDITNELPLDQVVPLLDAQYPITNKLVKKIHATYTDADFDKHRSDYPHQLAELCFEENVQQLKAKGFTHIALLDIWKHLN
jgi:hypothetical protein